MEASELNKTLERHQLWIETNGVQGKLAVLTGENLCYANLYGADLRDADLSDADLNCANLSYADFGGANLNGANLNGANLSNAILPDISWIIPGCLVQLNHVMDGFYLEKEDKWENFVQDTFGFFIQNDEAEDTFDMLLGDRIIRGIPDWVKYSGLKQILADSKDKTND